MGFLGDFFNKRPQSQAPKVVYSLPMEMIARFIASGQVVWFPGDAQGFIDNGYLGNHIIFTIQDWKSSKVASAPPLVYEIKDEKKYKLYRAYLQGKGDDNFRRSQDLKIKALEEVEGHDMQKVLDRPNPHMTRYEFEYGLQTYIDIVGAGYMMAVRSGVDGLSGPIVEMYLPPAHHMTIISGDITNPIKEYFLNSNPEKKINVANVCQIRNFSPRYESQTEWMYGLSRLFSAKALIQKYKDGTETEVSVFQNKGIRDIIFPKGVNDPGEVSIEDMNAARDNMNQKLRESGSGGIITNNIEIGAIRVGFSPSELGILESLKDAKTDLCALYHIPDIIFGWNEQTTFNNLSESRKIALTDAVLPALEQRKDALNHWLVPSYNKGNKKLVIDYDYEYFPELQADHKSLAEWMDKVPLTGNERRLAFKYDAITNDPNMDKAMVAANYKLVESMDMESWAGNPNDNTFGE